MARHLLISYPVLMVGAALVAYCARGFDKLRAARNYLIGLPIVAAIIAFAAATATRTEIRCPDSPNEYCIHNDSTPLIFVLVVAYFVACSVKSWLLYAER